MAARTTIVLAALAAGTDWYQVCKNPKLKPERVRNRYYMRNNAAFTRLDASRLVKKDRPLSLESCSACKALLSIRCHGIAPMLTAPYV
jgi:hypothetical protein